MKRRNISVFFVIALVTIINMSVVQAQEISKEVKTKDFNALCLEAVGKIYFNQGEKCSVILKGEEKNVLSNEVFVEGNTLYIKIKNKKSNSQREWISIHITAPTLRKLNINGAGEFHSNNTLKCEELGCELQGVGQIFIRNLICKKFEAHIKGLGNGKIDVDCQELKASIDGIGSLTLSGKAKVATISKEGIGYVDDDDLQIGK